MIPNKSVLLEQINTVIRKNTPKQKQPSVSSPVAASHKNTLPFPAELNNIRNGYLTKKNKQLIHKLEQRIEALEDQNNHLLYFIHFLYEHFPELVRNLVPAETIVTGPVPANTPELPLHPDVTPPLTRRETEVLALLVKGMCAKEIANTLFISETTVVTHKKNLKKKFNVRNTVELISKTFHLREG